MIAGGGLINWKPRKVRGGLGKVQKGQGDEHQQAFYFATRGGKHSQSDGGQSQATKNIR
jgi:hypothetical protein